MAKRKRRRRRDLLNNLTIKNCDKIEKFKKLKTSWFKKNTTTFRRSFNVIIKSITSETRTNINVKESLRDTDNKIENMKITKNSNAESHIRAQSHVKSLARIESF